MDSWESERGREGKGMDEEVPVPFLWHNDLLSISIYPFALLWAYIYSMQS